MALEDEVKKGRLISVTMTFEYSYIIENGKPKTKTVTVSRDEALKIGAIIYDKATYKKICDHEYKQNIGLANENDVVLSGFPVSGGGYAQDPTQENAMAILYTEPVDGEEVYMACAGSSHKDDWVP